MKARFIIPLLCVLPMMANAAIPYRVEQVKISAEDIPPEMDNEALAREYRFYVGAMYNMSQWQDYTNKHDNSIHGKDSGGFEIIAGMRIIDTVRTEVDYTHTDAQWDELSFQTDTFMVNTIVDARVDSLYRTLRNQMIVPYVGLGIGLSWNSANNGTELNKKIAPAVSAMAGLGIEFNEMFAVDLGYKYFYMFNPEPNIMSDLNPVAHQLRAGARISF